MKGGEVIVLHLFFMGIGAWESMKNIIKRSKFEHLFAFAMWVAVMVAMIFGMHTGNDDLINTGLTIINIGFGAVVGFFFRKDTPSDTSQGSKGENHDK